MPEHCKVPYITYKDDYRTTYLLEIFFGELMCFRTSSFEKPYYMLDFFSFQESKLICVIHNMVKNDRMFTDPE